MSANRGRGRLRGGVVFMVVGLLLVLVSCIGSVKLTNGLAPCSADGDCPAGYHCAVDLRCWADGQDPNSTIDGAVGPTDASVDRRVTGCSAGQITCAGACVDPRTDRAFCGATTGCGGDGGSPGTACANGEVCSEGTCRLSCAAGLVECQAGCFDPKTNPVHCGATTGCGEDGGSPGSVCGAGQVCANGLCAVTCAAGLVECNGTCVDPQTSLTYCGATAGCGAAGAGSAGSTCPSGQVCSAGGCSVSCQAGLVNCDGLCIDPQTSREHCGAALGCGAEGGTPGTACGAGEVCNAGTCALTCQTGLLSCNGTCIDPQTNRSYCGATTGCGGPLGGSAGEICGNGQVCNAGQCAVSCQQGLVECSGACIDPQTNRNFCGATSGCGAGGQGSAGAACNAGTICSAGSCSLSCQPGLIDCNGTCVDPLTNRNYCGATGFCGNGGGSAGTVCGGGQVCNTGSCSLSCQPGLISCNGVCINPLTDRNYCGASGLCGNGGGSAGAACAQGNVCSNGSCQLSCPGGQINCNGVCVNPLTDRNYCGASGACGNGGGSAGMACGAGSVCNSGSCQVSCPPSQVNCAGSCIDPATDRNYCGATGLCGSGGGTAGAVCGAGTACNNGVCSASCAAPLIACGTCVDPRFDPAHCGGCNPCPAVANATSFCLDSTCGIASCTTNFGNCNGVAADGCEVDTRVDPRHCGGCGNVCSGATPVCASGSCIAQPTVCGTAIEGGVTTVTCPAGTVIRSIEYASYGTPNGTCGGFSDGACHSPSSDALVAAACVGQPSCSVAANNAVFGDPCFGVTKRLSIQAACGSPLTNPVPTGLVAHYDARQGASVAQDTSSFVSTWNDLSGNGNDLSFNGTRPVYRAKLINGLPGLDFSGGAGMFSTGTFALGNSVTVFVVAQWRTPGQWGPLAHHGNRDHDWSMEQSGFSTMNVVHWQTNNDNSGLNLTLTTNDNYVLCGLMDPTNGRYFSASSTGAGLVSVTGGASTSLVPGSKRLYVGKSDVNEASNAYIGALLYYNRALSNAERDSVIAYLRSAWGI